jgi:hypothetical protein
MTILPVGLIAGIVSGIAARTMDHASMFEATARGFVVGQAKEKEKDKEQAGEAYEDSGYVVVDELGRPFKTDKLRREAQKLMEAAGVNGVPDTVVSAWAGHGDLSFTARPGWLIVCGFVISAGRP